MPYAEPPRCVLVARGAPNSAMMRQVDRNGDLQRALDAQQIRVAAGPLERGDEARQLVVRHIVRIALLGHHLGGPLGEMPLASPASNVRLSVCVGVARRCSSRRA